MNIEISLCYDLAGIIMLILIKKKKKLEKSN